MKSKFNVKLATSLDVEFPRIFEVLSVIGYNTFVVNVPLTYPLIKELHKRCFVISDWASPFIDTNLTRYRKDVLRIFTDYSKLEAWSEQHDLREYLTALVDNLYERILLLYELIHNLNWDLFCVVFSEIDWIQHRIPALQHGRGFNLIGSLIWLIDRFIQKLGETADLILIVSDHGFSRYHISVGINNILLQLGVLKLRDNKSVTRIHGSKLTFRMKQLLTRHELNTYYLGSLHRIISKLTAHQESYSENIDYARSLAFMLENSTFGIYCAPHIKDKLITVLKRFCFIKRIVSPAEIYQGSFVSRAPDIILVPKEGVWCSNSVNKVVTYDHVDHAPEGVFIALGDYVIRSKYNQREIPQTSILNVAPSLLKLYGIRISPLHDGSALPSFEHYYRGENIKTNYVETYRMAKRIAIIRKQLLHKTPST